MKVGGLGFRRTSASAVVGAIGPLPGSGQDEGGSWVSFGDERVVGGGYPGGFEPAQVAAAVGVVPEHAGAEVIGGSGPLVGSDNGQEATAGAQPPPDAGE